jgi:hypothetical protein
MIMKRHILAALREELDLWEELLADMSAAQITTPLVPSNWSIKDEIAHLWAWQQRTIARVEAALLDRQPEFPRWPAGLDPDGNPDQINAWIYETYRELPWSQVHQNWSEGFRHLLELAQKISEQDLLAGERYAWLNGYSLALFLLATYDHHQEHLEKLQTRLREL